MDRHSISILRDEFARALRILREERDPLPLLFEPFEEPAKEGGGEQE